MNQSERRQFLIRELLQEKSAYQDSVVPREPGEQKILLRALMNVRSPRAISQDFLQIQDEYLQNEIAQKGIVHLNDLQPVQPGLYLWKGDITTLQCDAIVNAANSGLTGCYRANHKCIDNCIHTFAGVQLRRECGRIMDEQGSAEPTGQAKITPAYNLPCKYVLHTVGPIVVGPLSGRDCSLLESCYVSCLKLAAEYKLESVAFCCISTGEFRFPKRKAAEIAVATVKKYMQTDTTIKRVVFNVFHSEDQAIYEAVLGSKK